MQSTAIQRPMLQTLIFAAGLGCITYATHAAPPIVSWLGLLLLGVPFILQKGRVPKTALTRTAILLTAWIIINILFFSPVLVPWIQYLPLYFITTFLLFSVLPQDQRSYLFAVFIALLIVSSLMAIVQVYFKIGDFTGRWPRATGLFSEVNTFATLVSIGMLPLIGRYLAKKSSLLLSIILLLFYALLLTQSRGGMLAFVVGLVTMLVLLAVSRIPLDYRRVFSLLLLFVLLMIAANVSTKMLAPDSKDAVERISSVIADQGSGRIDLYKLALNLRSESPFTGVGYGNFGFFFERDKVNYPHLTFHNNVLFTHNDYLGLWIETGIVGLFLYLAMIGAAFYSLKRVARNQLVDERLSRIIIASGIVAFFLNSTYDFPFYSLVTIVLAGAGLGYLNQLSAKNVDSNEPNHIAFNGISLEKYRWLVRTFFVAILLAWQLLVPLSDYYYQAYRTSIENKDYSGALRNLTTAIGLLPKFHLYHTAAGSLLADSAVANHNAKLATLADHEFEIAAHLNPYVPNGLVSRAQLHRDHPDLFVDGTSKETILGWLAEAHAQRPADTTVGYQYALTCSRFGKPDEALALIKFYREKNLIDGATAKRWGDDFGLGFAIQNLTAH